MKKIFTLFSIIVLVSCTSNKSVDDAVYEIRISNKSVSENTDFPDKWLSTFTATTGTMINANLFQCMNPGFEYGYVTVLKWNNLEQLTTNKPSNKLHRAYKRISEVTSDEVGEYSMIIVYSDDNRLNTGSNLKPNWDLLSRWMGHQKGFLGASLYESISKDATYKYITIANWDNLIDPSNIMTSKEFKELTENRSSHLNKKLNFYTIVKSK